MDATARFRRSGRVRLLRVAERAETWTSDSGSPMSVEPGDMIVTSGERTWSITPDSFAATYAQVEGDVYERTGLAQPCGGHPWNPHSDPSDGAPGVAGPESAFLEPEAFGQFGGVCEPLVPVVGVAVSVVEGGLVGHRSQLLVFWLNCQCPTEIGCCLSL